MEKSPVYSLIGPFKGGGETPQRPPQTYLPPPFFISCGSMCAKDAICVDCVDVLCDDMHLNNIWHTIMSNIPTREILIDHYVSMISQGFPQGQLLPFRKWVRALAVEQGVDADALMEDIRSAAMAKYKLHSRAKD